MTPPSQSPAPYIELPQLGSTIEINPQLSIMANLRSHSIPVASSCNGQGICCKCRVLVKAGMEHLTNLSPLEIAARTQARMDSTERLSCQTHLPAGTITLETPYW